MNDLQNKIERVRDEHAAESVTALVEKHNEREKIAAAFMLGRIRQNDTVSRAVASNLDAQTIRALEHFQQERMYEALGYETFVDFLNQSEYSPMSKSQYYERLALMREHGDEVYDLLTSVGIPVRAQKLLGKGEVAIRGDALVIGDQEISLESSGLVKQIITEFVDEARERDRKIETQARKIEDLERTLDVGRDELAQLERALDETRRADPHSQALTAAFRSLGELAETVGQMDDAAKAARGPNACQTLWDALQMVRRAYGIDHAFAASEPSPDDTFDQLAARVFAETGDLGDE